MAKPKSFLVHLEIDEAERAHDCQHNSAHRLQKGDVRLRVKKKKGPGYENFCQVCAIDAIDRDSQRLRELRDQISRLPIIPAKTPPTGV
jgi:hypothetical protein